MREMSSLLPLIAVVTVEVLTDLSIVTSFFLCVYVTHCYPYFDDK